MAAWEDKHAEKDLEVYFCECSEERCREHIELSQSQYEHVRSNSSWFVVASGHEVPEVETVVEEGAGWVIVEKDASVLRAVEATGSRRSS